MASSSLEKTLAGSFIFTELVNAKISLEITHNNPEAGIEYTYRPDMPKNWPIKAIAPNGQKYWITPLPVYEAPEHL